MTFIVEIIAWFLFAAFSFLHPDHLNTPQKMTDAALTPGKVVVMDNARFHQASNILTLIEERQCSLKYLPTYSPDLNPIEHCWQPIKHTYARHQHHFDDHANAINFAVNQYATTTLC